MIGICHPIRFTLVSALLLIGCREFTQGANERNRFAAQNENYEGYERLNLRRARSHSDDTEEPVSPEELRSSKVDPNLLSSMGSSELGGNDRKRRDQQSETDLLAELAESDAIAAAAESAAAEADAVAAAVEATEIEAANHNHGGSHHAYTENEAANHNHGGSHHAYTENEAANHNHGGSHHAYTENEAANHNHGGSHHAYPNDADSSITFEETDDGDNVVAVEPDLRENEHIGHIGGGHHKNDESPGTSEFDMVGADHGGSHGSPDSQNHVSEFDDTEAYKGIHLSKDAQNNAGSESANEGWGGSQSIDSAQNQIEDSHEKGYADVQVPLKALLAESTDLAKEIRMVFQVLSRREDFLVHEMQKLKNALSKAIQVLEENNKVAKLIRKRRDNDQNPYKACVYILPPNQGQGNVAPPSSLLQTAAPPTEDEAPSSGALTSGTSGDNDEIDLSSVYWLKLPEDEEEGVLEKVHKVLNGMQDNGKDVLLIPVTKGFMSNEDVAKGFLKAVRVNPAYTTSADSKRRRRKRLRLRILRI